MPKFLRYNVLAIEDALAVSASPGSLLVELAEESTVSFAGRIALHAKATVLAAGPPSLVDRHAASEAADVIEMPEHVLIPGLVNAHSHLDLTHIGARPLDPERGFTGFVDLVRSQRHQVDEQIEASVREGVERSLLGGVVAVGDIAGAAGGVPRLAPYEALLRSPLWGTCFVEFFSIGRSEEIGLERISEAIEEGVRYGASRPGSGRMRLGLSPHAPYSVSRRSYMRAVELANRYGLPLCTHLSETPDEVEFIGKGTGRQRELLERIGVWDDSILADIGQGKTPIQHLAPVLNFGDFVAAHCNFAADADVYQLADSRTGVVFCPRSAAYFGHADMLGPHRYLDMLFCGTRVTLGTDSIVNLWGPGGQGAQEQGPGNSAGEPMAISTLEEMRLLYRRDAVRAMTVLGMATMDGAQVLGLDPLAFTFKRGTNLAGINAVKVQNPNGGNRLELAVDRIMLGTSKAELLLVGK